MSVYIVSPASKFTYPTERRKLATADGTGYFLAAVFFGFWFVHGAANQRTQAEPLPVVEVSPPEPSPELLERLETELREKIEAKILEALRAS